MVYTVTLSPAIDYVINIPTMRSNDIIRSTDERFYCGGKGINVSTVLTRLGQRTTALGFVAGFTGAEIVNMLDGEGVDSDFIKLKSGNTRINVKLHAEKETDINCSGPAIDGESMKLLFEKLDGMQDGDWLVLAGNIPSGVDKSVYERMMERIKDRNIKVVVDTTGDGLLGTLKYRPFMIKPNHHEMSELCGRSFSPQNIEGIINGARSLIEKGAQNVLVSRGAYGATFVGGDGTVISRASAKGESVSSVGCGDSMVAGFIAGYNKTGSFEEALKLATAAGGATAFSKELATQQEINEVYKTLD